MRTSRRFAIFAAVVSILTAITLLFPLPPKHVLSRETSADGKRIAVYYWRAAGLVGSVGASQPWVYLSIYDVDSGEQLAHYWTWGDAPDDAYNRFDQYVSWHAKRRP